MSSRRVISAFAKAAGRFGIACCAILYQSHRGFDPGLVAYGSPGRQQEAYQAAQYLDAGSKRERVLAGGDHDEYRLRLTEAEYLRIAFNGTGPKTILVIHRDDSGPDTEIPGHYGSPSIISIISKKTAEYRFGVLCRGAEARCGSYRIEVQEIRPARPEDQTRLDTEKHYLEAQDLEDKGGEEALRKAIAKYQQAIEQWNTVGASQEISYALRNIGNLFNSLGDSKEALGYFERSLLICGQIGDEEGQAANLSELSYTRLSLSDPNLALAKCDEALQLSRKIGNRKLEARALNVLGEIWYDKGDKQQAITYFETALALWTGLADFKGEALAKLNLGYCHADLEHTFEAEKFYAESRGLWRSTGDSRGEVQALTGLLQTYAKLGEYQEAIEIYNQTKDLFQSMGDPILEARMFNNMGYVYRQMADAENALAYYAKARDKFQQAGYRTGVAHSLVATGRAHLMLNSYRTALDSFSEALGIFQALGDKRMQAWVQMEMGAVFDSSGDSRRALSLFEQALPVFRAEKDVRGEALDLRYMGRIHESAGRRAEALQCYRDSLGLDRKIRDQYNEWRMLYFIARAGREIVPPEESRDQLEEAMKIVESLRGKVPSQEMRISYFAATQQLFELYVDLLMQNRRQDPAGASAAAALRASERAKGRSLLELLAETRAGIRQGADPELLDRERVISASLNAKAERLSQLLSSKHTQQQTDALEKEISSLETQYDELQAQIKTRSPKYASLTQPEPLDLAGLQREVLDYDTLILEYALGQERSYLWTVGKDALESFELPGQAKIEGLVGRALELLRAPEKKNPGESARQRYERLKGAETQYWQAASELSRMLLGPAAGSLGNKRLLIVPDGALQYLPFGALPISEDKNGTKPLVVNHEIVVLPSASTLAVLRAETAGRKQAEKSVAVFADPVFGAEDAAVRKTGVRNANRAGAAEAGMQRTQAEGLKLGRLPSTRREAEAIISAVPPGSGMMATGLAANRARVISGELAKYRVVHFATHGYPDDRHPNLSWIALSTVDDKGRKQDGFLRLLDIYNLDLPADLVVLSACQTALGKNVHGEGLIGLVRGFMYAGAARVVASLWKVDDESTAELMRAFYRAMFQGGKSPAAALRQAQAELLRTKRWSAPYYWAGFVLQGEWK